MSTGASAPDPEAAKSQAPWYAEYPAPKSQPGHVTQADMLAMLKEAEQGAPKDFVLVDVRRNDHEGGTIRGSINLPAQSLHPTIPTLYDIFKAAGVKKTIWYCNSSRGRGTRAAAWFADYLAERKDDEMQSVILLAGIAGWASAGNEFVDLMDEYDENVWAAPAEKP